ncbi:UNVERIFIED_CONTAM: hypothetical protein GTU68_024145, partial [Idotea baltica]|nr:hypothetical protein [Idotea baltica]
KGARVTLDGDLETRTDEGGRFAFQNVKFGDHSLKVSFEGVEFDDVKTQLGLASAPLPDIVPARYQTCFSVTVDSSSDLNIPWLINVIGTDKSKHEIQTGSSGKACVFLQPGEYSASILLTAQDEEAGIRFGPEEHVFRVVSEPVLNMSFSQFLGEIHGSIECLEACRTLTVSLRPSKGSSGSPRTTTCNNGRFLFMEVVPGEYLLSVDKEEWCWREQTVLVAVNAKNVSARFEQTGFRLTLNTSHRTTLSYVTNKGHTGKLDVAEGTSRECVSAPGTYVFTPTGCHKFGVAPLTWDTSSPQLLSLTASHHLVTGTLLSSEPGPFSV